MSNAPLSGKHTRKIIDLRRKGKSHREIADALGISHGTVSYVLRRYGQEFRLPTEAPTPDRDHGVGRTDVGVPLVTRDEADLKEGSVLTADKPATLKEMARIFGVDTKAWVATDFRTNVYQGFHKIRVPAKDGGTGHRKVALWQSRVTWKRIMTETMELQILEFLRENAKPIAQPAARPRPAKPAAGKGQMLAWGLWDAHLGLYAWQSEVGANFNLDIAIDRITNSIDDMVEELRGQPIERIVMPVGNDFMHYDNVRQKTSFGEHHMDCDGRYGKVYAAGLRCLCHMVERAASLCGDVEILYVPGNHDLTSSYTLCVALAQRYRAWKGIRFDLAANPRKFRLFGGTLLGFTHGDGAGAQQLATIFPTECRDEWSKATYREIQVGHTHQRREVSFAGVVPVNGITIRTNPCLSNVDMWHHRQGLIGEPMKSVEAWRYDRIGYRGSHVAWARDDRNDAARSIPLVGGGIGPS